jgi:hypothetical protein
MKIVPAERVVEIRWVFPLGDEDVEIIGWSAVIEKKFFTTL